MRRSTSKWHHEIDGDGQAWWVLSGTNAIGKVRSQALAEQIVAEHNRLYGHIEVTGERGTQVDLMMRFKSGGVLEAHTADASAAEVAALLAYCAAGPK